MCDKQPTHADTSQLGEVLQEIIERNKEDGNATPSDKMAFKDAWVRLVRETGMTDEMIGYIFENIKVTAAEPLYLYAASSVTVDAYQAFLETELARQNSDGNTTRALLSLLALELAQPSVPEALDFIATSLSGFMRLNKRDKERAVRKYVIRPLANDPISANADMQPSSAATLTGILGPTLEQIASSYGERKTRSRKRRPSRNAYRADESAVKTLLGWLREHARTQGADASEGDDAPAATDVVTFDESETEKSAASSTTDALGQGAEVPRTDELGEPEEIAVVPMKHHEGDGSTTDSEPDGMEDDDGSLSKADESESRADNVSVDSDELGGSEAECVSYEEKTQAEVPECEAAIAEDEVGCGVTDAQRDDGLKSDGEVVPRAENADVGVSPTEQRAPEGTDTLNATDAEEKEPVDERPDNATRDDDSSVDAGTAQLPEPAAGDEDAQTAANPDASAPSTTQGEPNAAGEKSGKPTVSRAALEREIESLRFELKESQRMYADLLDQRTSLSRSYGELLSRFDRVQEDNTRVRESLEHAEKMLTMLREHKVHQTAVEDQKLVDDLRFEYQDYQDALDLDMSIDLGENMRDQLGNVFEILIAAGIDL